MGTLSTLKTKEKHPTVAFLGPKGTFTQQAAIKFFSKRKAKFLELESLQEVFEAVAEGKATYGVVPVENSVEGSVNLTLDLLYKSNLKICGEILEEIKHSLIVNRGTDKSKIKVILSHPQALSQCRTYLDENFPKAKRKEVESTASAVRKLKRMKNAAAIGTELAAKIYGMKILEKNLCDWPQNLTRFIVLSQSDSKPTGKDKTSLIFSTKDVPGALHKALEPFASRSINLTKIESRPSKEKPWEYVFFMEFEGHRKDEKCAEAIGDLRSLCEFLKVLGSYRRAS